ncbi:integral membrane sensor signal transduction histidine kinase [Solidesulfovibrio fructosivorans JJ]]|uniref:histidine kinase n=1 Tax=Solidesulfovibrio fructosivorans JJ] TaxID=596151 RepID=E1JZV8_SOLFR|nr:HAMP domain-containing sensor histidine kinase [Solidesulfovibrio fructosivorans]EFL50138.1 integral membrane sensor signal transduction histidine kinase [Solidesulfovibrio fructosivorans JJ]]
MTTPGAKFAAISVKRKLLALFGCILAGFLLVFAIDHLETRLIERTLELERLAVSTKIAVLGMRRQEKNYFLRHDQESLTAVRRNQQTAIRDVETIRELDPSHAAPCDAALLLLREYLTSFEAMTDRPAPGGIDAPAARFLERSRDLEHLERVDPALASGLVRLRLLEKRWLVSGAGEPLQGLEAEADGLIAQARSDGPAGDAAAAALSRYRDALAVYAGRLEQVGSTTTAFVAAARALEPMTEALEKRYETRRRDIARQSTLIGWGIQGAVLVLVALAGWAVFRSVAMPLAAIGGHARRVARGEASDLNPADFSGEFHALAKDIGRMETHLLATILDLARKEREAANEARRAREACRRAEDLGRVKANFLSLVSHELKTPLTSMVGFAQVMRKRLERGPLPQAVAGRPELDAEMVRFRDNLDIMLGEGRRLAQMIDNVLELSSLEAGETPLAMGMVSAAEIVDRAVSPFTEVMTEKGLRYACAIPSDLPPLRCDRERLVYVLRHLFSNAVKFTESGHIACRVTREGKMAVISVEDSGPGIPPEKREAVFEKFLQLGDNLTGKMPGLGIGLAAARAVVEYHGGSIRITGEPGKGSTVSVTVPLAEAA